MKQKLLFLMLLGGSLAFAAPVHAQSENDPTTYELLGLFGDVFERVRADYVEKVSDKDLIESAISGMLTSLDPHSSYLSADHFKEMQVQTKGEFGGLGIEVTMEGGLVKVVSPIDDTPAHRAGLKPGDLIVELDGEAVMGLTLSDAVKRMRGKVGTEILLRINREGVDPFDVTLTRAVVKLTSVRSRLEGDIGYIRVTSFTETTETGLSEAIDKLNNESKNKLVGLILDLRNNPGGLLDQAIAVSDAFLEEGEIVSTRSEQHPEEGQRFNARRGDLVDGLPMVVLINSGSASASEIVAGALQDQGRAVILGTRSFGKGSVQTIIPLSDHGAMRLTTSRYFTPSGRSIQAKGIDPDIEVFQAKIEEIDPQRRQREADLRGALSNGGGSDTESPSEVRPSQSENADEKSTEDSEQDFQLMRAIDLLKGVSVFSARSSG